MTITPSATTGGTATALVDPAEMPPPAAARGPWRWARENLFYSLWSTAVTVAGVALFATVAPRLAGWAVFDAVWAGETRNACAAGGGGACWPFIKVRLGTLLFGFYPEGERWRVALAFLLVALLLLPGLPQGARARRLLRLAGAPSAALGGWLLGGAVPAAAAGLLIAAATAVPWANRQAAARFRPAARWLAAAGLPLLAAVVGGAVFGAREALLLGLGAVAPAVGVAASGLLRAPRAAALWLTATAGPVLGYALMVGDAFGLPLVETHKWGGLFLTLVIAAVGIAASLPLGILLALGRRSRLPVIRMLSTAFIETIRGVPMITVLFMASVMLPIFLPSGITVDKLLRALIGVSLFAAAYMAEVVRGGLQAIPDGQYEAAKALGLGYWRSTRLVILPQALTLVVPAIVNTYLGLLKDTTLVAVIGLLDLIGTISTATADPAWLGFATEGYVFVGVVFWLLCYGMARYGRYLERALAAPGR